MRGYQINLSRCWLWPIL